MYEKLAAKPLGQRTQKEEMELACLEGRQPYCVICQGFMDVIQQELIGTRYWNWAKEEGVFKKSEEYLDMDHPFCPNCNQPNRDFSDGRLVGF